MIEERSIRKHVIASERPVFDRGRARNTPRHGALITNSTGFFHRTAIDRAIPRSNTTAQILGDPAPGRSALDMARR